MSKCQVVFDPALSTTAEEYVTDMSKNGREVEAYLEANPDIKQQIDDLVSPGYTSKGHNLRFFAGPEHQ
jgi:hypothetical protein